MKAILDRNFAALPARLMPLIARHLPRLHEASAAAYARELTASELSDIVAFARTPAARRYLQRSGGLLSDPDVAAANTAWSLSWLGGSIVIASGSPLARSVAQCGSGTAGR